MESDESRADERQIWDRFHERFPNKALPAPATSYMVDLDGRIYRKSKGSEAWQATSKLIPEAAGKLRGIPDLLPLAISASGRYLYDNPDIAHPAILPPPHPGLPARRSSGTAALLGSLLLIAAVGTIIGLIVAYHLDVGRAPSRVLTDSADFNGQRSVSALAFSPDDRQLVAADGYSGANLWLVSTWQLRRVLYPAGPPTAAAFSRNGRLLAMGDYGGSTILWTTKKMRRLHVFSDAENGDNGLGGVYGVAFSPNGKMLATGDFNGYAYLWSIATGRKIAKLAIPTNGNLIGAVAFSPLGRIIAVGDDEGTTYLWNVSTLRRVAVLDYPHVSNAAIGGAAFSPDGRLLATLQTDGSTVIWNLASRTPKVVLKTGDPEDGRCSIAFSPDGRRLIAGCNGPNTYIWNVSDGTLIATLTAPSGTGAIDATAFSPDGRVVAAGSDEGDIYLWDLPKVDR